MNTRTQLYFPLAGLALATFTLMSPQTASATVIYDNGAPLLTGGNNMGIAWQADDFILNASTDVTDVHFWTLEAPGTYRNSISWQIRANTAGSPGATLAGVDGFAGATRTATGRSTTIGGISYTEFEYDFNIASLTLGAGDYWLNLHNGLFANLGDPNDFLWSWTADNATFREHESFDLGVTWDSNFREHAFQITGEGIPTPAPEPGTVVLLATGLAGLLAWRRRAAESESENV